MLAMWESAHGVRVAFQGKRYWNMDAVNWLLPYNIQMWRAGNGRQGQQMVVP